MAGDGRRADMSSFHHIVLLAADNTEFSEYAFNWYKNYIHRPENFVVIVHCTDHQAEDFRDASPGRTAKMFKEYTEAMRTIEEKYGTLMSNAGIHGKIRKGNGKPGEAIIAAAAEEGASVAFLGSDIVEWPAEQGGTGHAYIIRPLAEKITVVESMISRVTP